jgi:hypothetical protein
MADDQKSTADNKDAGADQKDTSDKKTDEKTFTQDEINEVVKDRLKREREKYRDYEDLKAAKARLDEIEKSKLTDQEKTEARIKALEKALEEKDQSIKARDLRDAKRSKVDSLVSEKKIKLPDGVSISDILDLVTGSDEEAINESLAKLQKFFPIGKGVGGGSQREPGKELTIDDQINDLNIRLHDPKITRKEQQVIADQLIDLNTKKMIQAAKKET